MLQQHEIEANKQRFIDIVSSIQRPGANIEALIQQLNSSDFFTAPASTKYHSSFEGGLCSHSLTVYNNLKMLVDSLKTETGIEFAFDDNSVKIVALFHDISKMNYYENAIFNKKVYSGSGSKSDELGKFDWVSTRGFTVRDQKQRFVFGTHGENSERMIGTFIPLTIEESSAIINHHSVYDHKELDVTCIYSRYHLACLLHLADMISTYVLENVE